MNRRQFIVGLFGAVAARPVLEQLAPFVRPEDLEVPMGLSEPAFAPVYLVSLEEFRRLFDKAYREFMGRGYVLHGAAKPQEFYLGSTTPSGARLLHQWNVGYTELDLQLPEAEARLLPAAAAGLAISAAQSACGEFVPPPLPFAIPLARICGPVRMAGAYDAVKGVFLFRFDVLGAETEWAVWTAAERARQALKVRIRERLLVTRGTQMRLPA